MVLAIVFELLGTNCAKLSAGLKMVRPTLLMYITYGISVSFLAAALNNGGGGGNTTLSSSSSSSSAMDAVAAAWTDSGNDGMDAIKIDPTTTTTTSIVPNINHGLDLGVAYAAWSGIGTIVAALLGVFLYGETLVATQIIGIVLTIVGVTMVNLVPSTGGGGGCGEAGVGAESTVDTTDGGATTISSAMYVGTGPTNTYGSFDSTHNNTNI
jgi:multidrug transporter EmrE-like cation transporter